jgi:hypothetical protein
LDGSLYSSADVFDVEAAILLMHRHSSVRRRSRGLYRRGRSCWGRIPWLRRKSTIRKVWLAKVGMFNAHLFPTRAGRYEYTSPFCMQFPPWRRRWIVDRSDCDSLTTHAAVLIHLSKKMTNEWEGLKEPGYSRRVDGIITKRR